MDIRKRISFEEIRKIDMVDHLCKCGYQLTKIRNTDYCYLSILRNEKTASFKINRRLNCWYDHGIGKGGNIIDFALLFHNCTISELLKSFSEDFSFHQPYYTPLKKEIEDDNKIQILHTRSIDSLVLIRYLHKRNISIAKSYMEEIGFNQQPYLVYRHDDSGHPHIHIVSTNIEKNASRISLHNLGRNQSEKARKETETEFKLIKAQMKELNVQYTLRPVSAYKINYGKTETKRAISNVLMKVIPEYKFTSLTALNSVLKLYNVAVDSGGKGSRTFLNNGLFYRILDENGNKTGVPIYRPPSSHTPSFYLLLLIFSL